jgi:hypothetical protein
MSPGWIRGTACALLVAALAGCVREVRFGAGARRDDWQERRRRVMDPDPTANPTVDAHNPWQGAESPAPRCHLVDPPDTDTLGDVIAAGLAKFVGGWVPMFVISGTFEEDPEAARRDRDRQRARCAEIDRDRGRASH